MKNLIDEWARNFLDKPDDRRRGGQAIPRQIADFLAEGESPRESLESVIQMFWQRVQDDRGQTLDRGWTELAAGVLVAAELVSRKLPRKLHPIAPSVAECYQRERWRYARYALVVGDKARICRVLMHAGPDDNGPIWQLDGAREEELNGHSHTLVLELMAREQRNEILLPLDCAVAVTGVFNSGAIAPVNSLAEKCRAWFEHEPEGLLITAPLSKLDIEEWKAVVLRKPGKDAQHAQLSHDHDERKAHEQSWDLWITAASMEELCAKLELRFGNGLGEVRAWNNDILEPKHIAPLTMKWGNEQPDWYAKEPAKPLAMPFEDSIWQVARNALGRSGSRGVLVEGGPGAGKSLWSRLVQRQFATGPLGALGCAVRIGAREFVEALHSQPAEANWLELLPAGSQEQRLLHQRLFAGGRLIVVMDGLDELDEPDIHRVVELLQHSGCAFIATSRPLTSVRHALADALRVVIEPLTREASVSILMAHGRDDLARQLGSQRHGASPALEELGERPFTLSLLMGAIRRGESAHGLSESELYRRTYQSLIRRAHQAKRLDEKQARLLEYSAGELVGELALSWLRGSEGYIREPEMSTQLRRHGFSSRESVWVREALEFGYLLVPAAGAWEFAHRTLAEWAAAQALSRRVHEAIQGCEKDSPEPLDERHKSVIEMAEIGWLFEELDIHYRRASAEQILRFYAPLGLAPERLLYALVGPQSLQRLRVRLEDHELWTRGATLTQRWSFALDMLSSVTWRDNEAAMRCWGIVARALLLPDGLWPATEEEWTLFYRINENAIKRYVQSMAWRLPGNIEDLVALASLNDKQRHYFQEDPTRLIRSCSPDIKWRFATLRADGTFEQQQAILEWEIWWHDEAGSLEIPFPKRSEQHDATLERLTRELPRHIEKASIYTWQGEPDTRARRERMLIELEQLVYERATQLGQEIAWPVLRRRLQEWPHHLEKQFLSWFATRGATVQQSFRLSNSVGFDAPPGAAERRRQGLGVLLARITEAQHWLEQHKSLPDEIMRAYPEAFASVSDEEMAQHTQFGMESKLYWAWSKAGSPAEFRETVLSMGKHKRALVDVRRRLCTIVERLAGCDDWFDEVVGELWQVLPPGCVEADTLLEAMAAAERIAVQVPLSALLARLDEGESMLPERWKPLRWHDAHEDAWHELAQHGRGRERFLALQWCARREGMPLSKAFSVPMGQGDPELDALLLDWWQEPAREQEELELLPPDCLVEPRAMPLRYQALWNVDGWRETLLERLRHPRAAGYRSAVELAKQYPVGEALPLLLAQLDVDWETYEPSHHDVAMRIFPSHPDAVPLEVVRSWMPRFRNGLLINILDAVIASLRADNRDMVVKIIPWLGKQVISPQSWTRLCQELLAPEDLSALLAVEHLPGDEFGAGMYPLVDYWKRLDSSAHASIVAALEQQKHNLLAGTALERRERERRTRWITELRHAAILTGIRGCQGIDDLVDLSFRILNEDAGWYGYGHESGFDDFRKALERKTAELPGGHHENVIAALTRLLEHPAPALQRKALELCLERMPANARGSLMLQAIQAHLRCTHGYRDKDVALALARQEANIALAGWIDCWHYVWLIDTGRLHVTVAHRDRLREWLAHERAELRYMACSWIGLVGAMSWTAELHEVMNDVHPAVAFAAVRAWCRIEPGGLDHALATLSRSNWRAAHYALFASYWLGASPVETDRWERVQVSALEPLIPERIVQITCEAWTALLESEGKDEVGLMLLDSPSREQDSESVSLLEQLLSRAAQSSSDDWLCTALAELPWQNWIESIPADGALAPSRSVVERIIARWLPALEIERLPAPEDTVNSASSTDTVQEQKAVAPGQKETESNSTLEQQLQKTWEHLCQVFPPE